MLNSLSFRGDAIERAQCIKDASLKEDGV